MSACATDPLKTTWLMEERVVGMGRVALFGLFLYLFAKSLYTLLFKLINVACTVVNLADWKALFARCQGYFIVHSFEQRFRASICGDEVQRDMGAPRKEVDPVNLGHVARMSLFWGEW